MEQNLIYFYKNSKSIKEKNIYISKFKKKLISKIEINFNSVYLDFPFLFTNNSKYSFPSLNRSITFDSNKVKGFLKIYNDNLFWINDQLFNLKIPPGKSVYSIKKFLNRDSNILDNQPIESEHLLIELIVAKEDLKIDYLISIYKKINSIINDVINELTKIDINVENDWLFENIKVDKLSNLKIKFPFHSLSKILESHFSETQSIAFLSNEMSEKINFKYFDFDPIQNNLSNTLYYLYYNKNSNSNSLLYKISERPSVDVINKQAIFFNTKNCNKKTLEKYDKNNIYSYVIDLNLSTIISSLFSEFSITESSHSPGNDELEKKYSSLNIKII